MNKYLNVRFHPTTKDSGLSHSQNRKVYVRKTISITPEQSEWINDKTINLSRFVQKKIQEIIDGETR